MNEKNPCVSSSWIDVVMGHPPWSFLVKLAAVAEYSAADGLSIV